MSWRKIHLDNEVWEYQIGRTNVVIKSPASKKIVVGFCKLTGRSWDIIERGQWKKTTDGMVTPKDVRIYIQKHLRNAS